MRFVSNISGVSKATRSSDTPRPLRPPDVAWIQTNYAGNIAKMFFNFHLREVGIFGGISFNLNGYCFLYNFA